jgi:hypothetical protein
MQTVLAKQPRRSVRRATRAYCHAVGYSDFEEIGDMALDLSPRGMLVACDVPAAIGEEVVVSFMVPGADILWLDAEAEVARIIHGYRHGDPGYCVGLRFTYLERSSRDELLTRLAGRPPPIPQRRPGSMSTVDSRVERVSAQPIVSVYSASRRPPLGMFTA